jgi:integrase/recombinase XerD
VVKVLRSVVRGSLEPYVAGFVEELFRQGYTRSSAENHVCFIAHFDRWLSAESLTLAEVSGSVIARYFAARNASGYAEYRSVSALQPLLAYLRPSGVLAPVEVVVLGPVEELLGRYRLYLLGERGLTAGTARGYGDVVQPFLAGRVRGDVVDVASLSAVDVTGFIRDACPGRAVGSAKLIVCGLRSLLSWLHLIGELPTPLAAAVPAVAGRRLAGLPKALEPGQLRALVGSCDRRTPTGRRDYAILLLLSRLGLRAGEVAALSLDDIDWRRGQLTVRGKGDRVERLPLPADVGTAMTAYLRRGRPADAQGRTVFVRVHAPRQALSSGGITQVVFGASQRAGLPKLHAHRLRHTAATAMLQAGSPLTEVGQVLRHRSALTTSIYAKVDRTRLATLARPWPAAAAAVDERGDLS